MPHFNVRRAAGVEQTTHLVDGVCAPYGCWRIMAGEAAAVKRPRTPGESEMQWMPDEIIDENGQLRHPQRLIGIRQNLAWLEMMCEKTAGHHVESAVAERQRQSVAHNSMPSARQVAFDSIQQRHLNFDAGTLENVARGEGNLTEAGAGFEQPQLVPSSSCHNTPKHGQRGGLAAKQAVERLHVRQRPRNFSGRPLACVDHLVDDCSFHMRKLCGDGRPGCPRSQAPQSLSLFGGFLKCTQLHFGEFFFQQLFVVELSVITVPQQKLFVRAQFHNLT